METRYFVIESTDGPTPQGIYTITAKDVLKLADDDRSQAPALSNGFLVADISDTDTTATLSPSGIGNAEYPSSGYVAIGGKEICSFTRSADVMTFTEGSPPVSTRGQLGTTAVAHEAGDRVQIVLRYVGEDPADVIYDLLVNYAGIPSDYIPLSTWQTETGNFLQRLYTATIAEPTGVNTLISELVEQAALAVWWEASTQQIRLQVLRAISTEAERFTEDNVIEASLNSKEQPDTRISEVWTYFGQRNPLEPVDRTDNYRSVAITADLVAEADYGSASIKKIFSRWIPFGGRTVASRLNDIQLGRFKDPPRSFSLETFKYGDVIPMLGGGYRLESWSIQDTTGASSDAPIQVTRLNPMTDRYQIEAQEMLFENLDPVDLVNRVIILDSSINDVNLRDLHDSIYPAPTGSESPPVTLTVYIEPNVIVGSTNGANPAFDIGTWPSGIDITVYVRGRIQGKGGDGGHASETTGQTHPGGDGGTALYTRYAFDLILNEGDGEIWGGGGGGAGGRIKDNSKHAGGGGGGQGQTPGNGGLGDGEANYGTAGTTEAPGAGGPHTTSQAESGATGGTAGNAGGSTAGGSYGSMSRW